MSWAVGDDALVARYGATLPLAVALLCRYDHPVTNCRVMGSEIDRRLGAEPNSRQ